MPITLDRPKITVHSYDCFCPGCQRDLTLNSTYANPEPTCLKCGTTMKVKEEKIS